MFAHGRVSEHWYGRLFLVTGVLAAVLVIAALAIKAPVLFRPAAGAVPVEQSAAAVPAIDLDRSNAASVARWVAMGNFFAAREAAAIERSNAASAARWEAMGNFFAAREAAAIERSNAASAARWEAMGNFFAAREAAAIERSNAASAARWEAMGRYYTVAGK